MYLRWLKISKFKGKVWNSLKYVVVFTRTIIENFNFSTFSHLPNKWRICQIFHHFWSQKMTYFTIFRNFWQMIWNFLKNLWKFMEICGNLWKSRMEISTDFRKLPEILTGLRISRNFHRFPFPEIWECSHCPSLQWWHNKNCPRWGGIVGQLGSKMINEFSF